MFEFSAEDGSDVNKIIVPFVFGRALVDPYHGFAQYAVVPGDTLSRIADRFYGEAARWSHVFEANRREISDPDRIRPGQVLRVPL